MCGKCYLAIIERARSVLIILARQCCCPPAAHVRHPTNLEGVVAVGLLLLHAQGPVCLLQRMFSEELAPDEGVALDSVNQHPLPFTGDDLPDPLYQDLFERVWDYANDPAAAERLGVRAIQAEAPSVEARAGQTYRLELRQSGGMTLRAER